MRCRNCGAELPENSRYCDVCGQRNYTVVKREQSLVRAKKRQQQTKIAAKKLKKGCLTALVVLASLFILGIIVGIFSYQRTMLEYEEWDRVRDLSSWKIKVSAEERKKLQVGMTYSEIRDIVGGDGKLVADTDYHFSYAWPGEYYCDYYRGTLIVDFYKEESGSKFSESELSTSIQEHDITDGQETFETYNLVKDFNYEDLDTVIVTKAHYAKLTEGMNYEQVCEVFGGPGKLYSSDLYEYTHARLSYTTYIWKARRDEYYTDLRIDFSDGILKSVDSWRADYID